MAWIVLAASLWLIARRVNAGTASSKEIQEAGIRGESGIQDSA
jgi:hypothetical protein